MKKNPKFQLGDRVHIHGTSGVGLVYFIEDTGHRYVYTVIYPDSKRKQAEETELIKVQ